MKHSNINSLVKKTFLTITSAVVVVAVFVTGFYVGNTNTQNGHVTAAEQVDLEEFWRVWNLLDEKFVAASSTQEISPQDRLYGAIEGLVDSYGDPYTTFLPPRDNEKFNESLSGNFQGVGMEVGMENDRITVVSPLKGAPAEIAGVRPGDIILEIDGVTTQGMSLSEGVNLIRGEQGTVVEITVYREGFAEPIVIPITRDVIQIPTVDTELRDDGVFVISLYNFNADATRAFREALREFLTVRSDKLILDLRGNPGGFLDSAVDIASWFLPTGKEIVSEDFGDGKDPKVFRSKGFNIFNQNLKMVVLVDQGSASASEIVAGALQEHGIAQLVGTDTFGKGSVQELIPVSDSTALKVTIARWLTPDGNSISDGGLKPDVFVDFAAIDFEEGIDPQMNRAVELLNEL